MGGEPCSVSAADGGKKKLPGGQGILELDAAGSHRLASDGIYGTNNHLHVAGQRSGPRLSANGALAHGDAGLRLGHDRRDEQPGRGTLPHVVTVSQLVAGSTLMHGVHNRG